MKRINLFIGDDEWTKLRTLAGKKGGTLSEHVRRAIAFYLALAESEKAHSAQWHVGPDVPFAEAQTDDDDDPWR